MTIGNVPHYYSRVYRTALPKIPFTRPILFSYPVTFLGDCPAIVRIEVDGVSGNNFLFGDAYLAGNAELNTEKMHGNSVQIPDDRFSDILVLHKRTFSNMAGLYAAGAAIGRLAFGLNICLRRGRRDTKDR